MQTIVDINGNIYDVPQNISPSTLKTSTSYSTLTNFYSSGTLLNQTKHTLINVL